MDRRGPTYPVQIELDCPACGTKYAIKLDEAFVDPAPCSHCGRWFVVEWDSGEDGLFFASIGKEVPAPVRGVAMAEKTEGIAPALAPIEWRLLRVDERARLAHLASAASDTGPSDNWQNAHVAMALANAALPDGDPRKITHDDVAACMEGIVGISQAHGEFCVAAEFRGSTDKCTCSSDADALARLAAKLRAILPPK